MTSSAVWRKRRVGRRTLRPGLILWLAVPLVLWWALHGVPFEDILAALGRLKPAEALILIVVNLGVVSTFSGRWWVILRALGVHVPYLSLSAYRLAGFSVSYFTPGPQFGGEPLQVHLLRRRHAVPMAVAVASVALDRAIELFANFTFLAIGVLVVLRLGLIQDAVGAPLAVVAFALLLFPAAFLLASWAGRRPASRLLARAPGPLARWAAYVKLQQTVAEAESQVTTFCRRHPRDLGLALTASAASWLALLFEYRLALGFLGLDLDPQRTLAVVTAARLAILLPFPGGLGALEASQVLALRALGYAAAEGAGMGLLIRARDLLFGGAGLLMGGFLARERRKGEGSKAR